MKKAKPTERFRADRRRTKEFDKLRKRNVAENHSHGVVPKFKLGKTKVRKSAAILSALKGHIT